MTRGIAKVVAVLAVAPLVQVGVTAAATDRSAPSGSGALGRVIIRCEGRAHVIPPRVPAHGRCTITGAIADRGRFVDGDVPGKNPHLRTVFGAKGTIVLSVYRERGNWRVIKGTKAYAGLRGRGWESSSSGPCPRTPMVCIVSFVMTGKVWQ